MQKSIISEGKTTNEAIENGLKELKVSKNMVEIKVLENENKRSFFDILAPRVVKVELTLKENAEKELGDLLFAITNYARHKGFEPEVALTGTNDRFASRFAYVEEQVISSKKDWKEFTLAELDQFWDEAKLKEKN